MSPFALNVFLALIWAAATGDFGELNLVFGFALGFIIIYFGQRAFGPATYAQSVWKIVSFILYFIWELCLANVRVAYDVITPSHSMRPAVVAIPLTAKTDFEILMLTNFITLTPGSVALDVSDDRSVLYLHAMFVEDPDGLRYEIQAGVERRLLEVLR